MSMLDDEMMRQLEGHIKANDFLKKLQYNSMLSMEAEIVRNVDRMFADTITWAKPKVVDLGEYKERRKTKWKRT